MAILKFYIPSHARISCGIPQSLEDYGRWHRELYASEVRFHGRYVWTIRTYLELQARGYDCELVHEFPKEGVVFSFRDWISFNSKPPAGVFLVCIKPDREPSPFAHVHVVQNTQDPLFDNPLYVAYFLPFWPQPGLIARNIDRGETFENVRYFGSLLELSPSLKAGEWCRQLNEHGFHWNVQPSEAWHDYSDTDAIVAARQLDGDKPDSPWTDRIKPYSKLINAWSAGVPAILGRESAYRQLRKSSLDYIEVSCRADVVKALITLSKDPTLRHEMVANGQERAKEFDTSSVAKRWETFVEDFLLPKYRNWQKTLTISKQAHFLMRIPDYIVQKASRRHQGQDGMGI